MYVRTNLCKYISYFVYIWSHNLFHYSNLIDVVENSILKSARINLLHLIMCRYSSKWKSIYIYTYIYIYTKWFINVIYKYHKHFPFSRKYLRFYKSILIIIASMQNIFLRKIRRFVQISYEQWIKNKKGRINGIIRL